MPLMFSDDRGVVRTLAVPAAGCRLRPGGREVSIRDGPTYAAHAAILTRVQVGESVNIQSQMAVGGLVHYTVFGDHPGRMVLSGLQFDPADAAVGSARRWWQARRASANKDSLTVTFYGDAVRGLVVDAQFDTGDAADGYGSWQATLMVPPIT